LETGLPFLSALFQLLFSYGGAFDWVKVEPYFELRGVLETFCKDFGTARSFIIGRSLGTVKAFPLSG